MIEPQALAHHVDHLVHHELDDPFTLEQARLYVVPVGCRSTIELCDVDEHPYRLLVRNRHHAVLAGGALVVTGWCAPTDDLAACRPSEHPRRQRVRVTVAINGQGIATVLRRDGDPEIPELMDDRGEGELPDALERWWNGVAAMPPMGVPRG